MHPRFELDRADSGCGDERILAFFESRGDRPLVVEAVEADAAGGLRLSLSGGSALEVFSDDSLPHERWRLFQPGTAAEHFVVTGRGIERD